MNPQIRPGAAPIAVRAAPGGCMDGLASGSKGNPMNDVERGLGNMEFAQAVSRLHRLARKGDRSRAPTDDLRVLLERAEVLALAV